MNWLLKLLNKNALKYASKIDLSVGTIYLKPLTNGLVNNCRAKSCIGEDLINNHYFLQLIEYEICNLSKKEINILSVEDGNLLRDGIRNILIKKKVIKIEGVTDNKDFSAKDIRKLEEMKTEVNENLKKLQSETGYKAPGVIL